jgi:hypothetical protein
MAVVDWRPKQKGKEDYNQQSELEERGEEWRRSTHTPAIENKSNLWTTFLDRAGLITRLIRAPLRFFDPPPPWLLNASALIL